MISNQNAGSTLLHHKYYVLLNNTCIVGNSNSAFVSPLSEQGEREKPQKWSKNIIAAQWCVPIIAAEYHCSQKYFYVKTGGVVLLFSIEGQLLPLYVIISHIAQIWNNYTIKLFCEIVKPSGGSHARHRFSDKSLKSGDNHFQIALPASPTNYLVILSQPFCGFGQLPGATVYQNLSTL